MRVKGSGLIVWYIGRVFDRGAGGIKDYIEYLLNKHAA
jgi:hypothetical protein